MTGTVWRCPRCKLPVTPKADPKDFRRVPWHKRRPDDHNPCKGTGEIAILNIE